MKPLEIHQYEQRLDDIIRISRQIADLELQSHFARYICILVAGYVEVAVEAIFTELSRRQSSPLVARYVAKQLSWNLSLNMKKIVEIAREFDDDLASWVESEFIGEIADSLNSIKANRDNFAHGGTGGISLRTIINYHDYAREFVRRMCERIVP